MTTVLGAQRNEGLERWRKRVGDAEADKQMMQASVRGTAAHDSMEFYVKGEDVPTIMPNEYELFLQLKETVDCHVGEVFGIESQMISDRLETAGTVDLIAEWDGEIAIIDYKTSKKPKKREWVYNYFMQESAYAVMLDELKGIRAKKIVTIIATETNEPQIFVENPVHWIPEFLRVRKVYDQLTS